MSGDVSASKTVVSRPAPGLAVQVPTRPGAVYSLDFDHLEASFEQNGRNMELSFPDGAVLTLQGFCQATASADITLELQDGTQFSGVELVEALSMSLQDFHTDAPPIFSHSVPGAGLPRLEDLLDTTLPVGTGTLFLTSPEIRSFPGGEQAAFLFGRETPLPDAADPSSVSCAADGLGENLDLFLSLLRGGFL